MNNKTRRKIFFVTKPVSSETAARLLTSSRPGDAKLQLGDSLIQRGMGCQEQNLSHVKHMPDKHWETGQVTF